MKTHVRQLLNKNQFIIYEKNKLTFQSYDTTIAIYNKDNNMLFLNKEYWNYSRTTLKHLYEFIYRVIPNTQLAIKLQDSKNKQKYLKDKIQSKEIHLFSEE